MSQEQQQFILSQNIINSEINSYKNSVLELLKNIFNVPRCVFILAIDYQVVVPASTNIVLYT